MPCSPAHIVNRAELSRSGAGAIITESDKITESDTMAGTKIQHICGHEGIAAESEGISWLSARPCPSCKFPGKEPPENTICFKSRADAQLFATVKSKPADAVETKQGWILILPDGRAIRRGGST